VEVFVVSRANGTDQPGSASALGVTLGLGVHLPKMGVFLTETGGARNGYLSNSGSPT